MRKLASLQRITEIKLIQDADKIECAVVLGWNCVVKKGEFKVGDLIVYIEADSMLPFNPWTGEDLTEKPLRLKTVRMKKQLSQGLVLSASIPKLANLTRVEDGLDITEVLGITKYEPPPLGPALAGVARGNFPSFLIKTDETRIQSCPGVLSRYPDDLFALTEKIDGTSTTYYSHVVEGEESPIFGACSRNLDLLPGESVQWKVAEKSKIAEALAITREKWNSGVSVQGELAGPNIQGNKLGLKEVEFFAFNLFDIKKREFIPHGPFMEWCSVHGIRHVPVLKENLRISEHTVESLVTLVTVKSQINPEVWIEGGVFRPLKEKYDPDLGRLSFKCINPEWLLKYNE